MTNIVSEHIPNNASNATVIITPTARGFIVLYVYLLVFIHLEDTIWFSPSRYVKSLLPSLLSVPSPFDVRNERHYPRKFRSLPDKMSIMSGSNWPILDELLVRYAELICNFILFLQHEKSMLSQLLNEIK